MAIVVDATYENGVLKPDRPLPLKQHEKVRVTVEPTQPWAERTYGLVPWTGDPQTLRRIAEDPEFGIREAR
jgi:predicted DNA-binding antitoxin AbrB/MazE fold protein